MISTKPTVPPRIYVACLAAYNSGRLHGTWINATDELDDIWNQVNRMLANSPVADAEEWAIHDYEGFGSLGLSEHEGIERVHELAAFIDEHEQIGLRLLEHFCGNLEDAVNALENHMGCHASLADYAQELTEETTEIPEHLKFYIDYEAMARDMELNGDVFTIETGIDEVHVFLNH